MTSTVKALQEQLREAKAQARCIGEQLRSKRKCQRLHLRREEAKESRIKEVGLRIVAVASDATQALQKWLEVKIPDVQEADRYRLQSEVEEEFISLEIESINRMLEPIAHSEKAALQEAKAAVTRWELHEWVSLQNLKKGLAPTVGAIIQQRDRVANDSKRLHTSDDAGRRRSQSASYKWISRWRQKWSLPKGSINDRDSPTPAEMRVKVMHSPQPPR